MGIQMSASRACVVQYGSMTIIFGFLPGRSIAARYWRHMGLCGPYFSEAERPHTTNVSDWSMPTGEMASMGQPTMAMFSV